MKRLPVLEEDRRSIQDSWSIRNTALQNRITYYTTLSGARAACIGMTEMPELRAYDNQSLHDSRPCGSCPCPRSRSPPAARSGCAPSCTS